MVNYDRILNQRIVDIKPSGIRKYFDILSEMKDAISLSIGEPDFDTPWHISDAAITRIENGATHYTGNRGTPALRRQISLYLSERYGVEYDPATQITVTIGASEGIDLALRAILSPGDEVIIPDPAYVSYLPVVTMCGGKAVPLRTFEKDEFRMRPDALRALITDKTKAVIFPYPNNPTGAIMEKEDLEGIAEVLRGTQIMVISDEIYSELTYGGKDHVSIASIDGMYERTILLNGFSKSFAMTGWRVGYLCGPKPLVDQMVKIHQFTILCAPVMGQAAATAALISARDDDYEDVHRMKRTYDIRRRLLVSELRRMGLPCFEPRGAFYVFPNISGTGMTSEEFCDAFLMEEHVACIPGTAFGESGEGFIRISYAAATKNIEKALEKMQAFLKRHGG